MNDDILSQIIPIHSPWNKLLLEVIKGVQNQLFIISPYIKDEVVSVCKEILHYRNNAILPLEVKIITRTVVEEFAKGSSDIKALQNFFNWPIEISGCTVEIRAINNVHAKVWICDTRVALVGSGNATSSGLGKNLEYGLAVYNPKLVNTILNDWNAWWEVATCISNKDLEEIQIWLEQVKNNRELQEIEIETEKKRKQIISQIGSAPRVGSIISLTNDDQMTFSLPISKVSETKNTHYAGQILQNLHEEIIEVQTSQVRQETNDNIIPTLDELIDLDSTTLWRVITDPDSTLNGIRASLIRYNKTYVRETDGNVVIDSTEYPSARKIAIALDKITKVTAIPSDAIHISLMELWRTIIWAFPIVEKIRFNERSEWYRKSGQLLTIDFSQKLKKKKLIKCTWIDETRTSQIVCQYDGPQIPFEITLDASNTIKLMNYLNLSVSSHLTFQPRKLNVSLLVDAENKQLHLYFYVGFSTSIRTAIVRTAIISCNQVSTTTFPTPVLPQPLISFMPDHIQKALSDLFDSHAPIATSPSIIEVHLDAEKEKAWFIFPSNHSNSSSLAPTIQIHNYLSTTSLSTTLRFDSLALLHAIFYSLQDDIKLWTIYVDNNQRLAYLVPNGYSSDDQPHLPYHKLKLLE